ncbi:MAG: MFS transporter [Pseudomonadota bacterium]
MNPKSNSRKLILGSGLIGNALDNYDTALYVYLAPFIAPIFFEKSDPVVALILAYGLMSTNVITKPLGALLFGKMALAYGAKRTLLVTLTGVAVSTFCLGLLPGYAEIGICAPILLAIIRMIQGFFASGEASIMPLMIIEQAEPTKRSRASSYYLCSTMGGIMLASLAATWVSQTDNPGYYWRMPFFASILTAIAGLWLRSLFKDIPVEKIRAGISASRMIVTNKGKVLRVVLVSSFSYITYAIPFIFMNKFLPMISNITDTEMLAHNNMLLALDIMLLLVFGRVAEKFSYNKWMAVMSGLLAFTIVPVFYLLPISSIWEVTMLRLWIVVLGVAFVAPLKAWFYELFEGSERYLVMGFGYAIGTELLGRNSIAICWTLFYVSNNYLIPAFYIMLVSLLATAALLWPRSVISVNAEICSRPS